MTTNDPILAALRGEPAPSKITAPKDPTGQLLTTYPRMVFDALESAARTHVRNMIVHEGASPLDAQGCTDIDIKNTVRDSVRAGATDLNALDEARRVLDAANAKYKGTPGATRRHTLAMAEAQARAYTPRLVRETREEYQR